MNKICKISTLTALAFTCSVSAQAAPVSDGSVLPFPEPGQASVTGKTLKDSKHQWRQTENHLAKDAPNIGKQKPIK